MSFAILLEGADTAAAENLARLVLEVIVEPFVVGGKPRSITASVGVAVGAVADIHPHELLRFADLAVCSSPRASPPSHRPIHVLRHDDP